MDERAQQEYSEQLRRQRREFQARQRHDAAVVQIHTMLGRLRPAYPPSEVMFTSYDHLFLTTLGIRAD